MAAPDDEPGKAGKPGIPKNPENPAFPIPLDPDIAQWVMSLDDNAREFFNERAGIREFEAGMPRQDAEMEAQKDVLRWLSKRQ
jgi:hypothetical protein